MIATREDGIASVFFEHGVMYATGRSVCRDLVAAHKWFNLAAQRGNRDAIRWRREIASEMSAEEIAAAQRAARLEATDPEVLARQLIVVADDVEAVAA